MRAPKVILALVQVLGLVFVIVGMFHVAAWLGLTWLGITLFIVGLYLERNWPEKEEEHAGSEQGERDRPVPES